MYLRIEDIYRAIALAQQKQMEKLKEESTTTWIDSDEMKATIGAFKAVLDEVDEIVTDARTEQS